MYKEDRGILAVIFIWIFIVLINLAWIGTLIWAIIYILTHISGWIHG
jgi:hypothetical protein